MRITRRGLVGGMLATAATPARARDVQRRLRVADTQSYDYPTVQALLHMDRLLRARTEGRLALQVFASGQLGDEEDTIHQTRIGAVHLTRVNVAALATLAPLCNLLCLPNLIRSDAQLTRVLDSDVGREILAGCEGYGLVGLAFYEAGARSIYNRMRPVRTPEDMQGLRIRVQQSPIMERAMAALGAIPVGLSYGQLLPALQADLVDGAENNWPSYVTTDHHRAAPHYTLTEHARPPEILLVSKRIWDGLGGPDQDALRDAAMASRVFHRSRFTEWTEIAREQARAEGVQVVEDFDGAAFERLWRPIRDLALEDPDVRRLATRSRELE